MKRATLLTLFLALSLLATPLVAFAEAPQSSSNCTYHVVKRGETLSGIAVHYGVDMWTLARQNNITNPNRIYAGQTLLIRCAPPPKPAPKPTPKPPYYPPPAHPGDAPMPPDPGMQCQISPVLGFGRLWYHNKMVRTQVGCPTAAEMGIAAYEQAFYSGHVVQDVTNKVVYVLYKNGMWEAYPDTWQSGEPVNNPSLRPPRGYFQPEYGIGKVWRNEDNVSQRLGWARSPQQPVTASYQPYEHGQMIWSQSSGIFVLYDNGKWQRYD